MSGGAKILEGLRDAAAATAPSWQPIETAPKDGTKVLVFYPRNHPRISIAEFIDSETLEYGKSVRKRQYWWATGTMSFGDAPGPTHWMPLPELPEARA